MYRFIFLLLFIFFLPAYANTALLPLHPPHSQHEAAASTQTVTQTCSTCIKPKRECVDALSGKVCGYNCVEALGNAKCARKPNQVCKADSFDKIACGYECEASTDDVACSQYPDDNCVKNSLGEIKCGENCRIEDLTDLVCDKERYAS